MGRDEKKRERVLFRCWCDEKFERVGYSKERSPFLSLLSPSLFSFISPRSSHERTLLTNQKGTACSLKINSESRISETELMEQKTVLQSGISFYQRTSIRICVAVNVLAEKTSSDKQVLFS